MSTLGINRTSTKNVAEDMEKGIENACTPHKILVKKKPSSMKSKFNSESKRKGSVEVSLKVAGSIKAKGTDNKVRRNTVQYSGQI
jgi:DNA-directed RNA polymerase subunit RPC12/RpoP